MKIIDSWELNHQIPITRVAEDWGLELRHKGKNSWHIYCPNPSHKDSHMGSCVITEDGDKNAFHCFSCGCGGGPINLVMLLDNCDFLTAKRKLIDRYGVEATETVPSNSRWTGLTAEEYKVFGLTNPVIKVFDGYDEWGREKEREVRWSLRDLAHESPELHDQLLIKAFSALILAQAQVLDQLEKGFLELELGSDFAYTSDWVESFRDEFARLWRLLGKGLMNKAALKQLDPARLLAAANQRLNFTRDELMQAG